MRNPRAICINERVSTTPQIVTRITHAVTIALKKIIEVKTTNQKFKDLSEIEDDENVPLVPRKRKANT